MCLFPAGLWWIRQTRRRMTQTASKKIRAANRAAGEAPGGRNTTSQADRKTSTCCTCHLLGRTFHRLRSLQSCLCCSTPQNVLLLGCCCRHEYVHSRHHFHRTHRTHVTEHDKHAVSPSYQLWCFHQGRLLHISSLQKEWSVCRRTREGFSLEAQRNWGKDPRVSVGLFLRTGTQDTRAPTGLRLLWKPAELSSLQQSFFAWLWCC